MSSLNQCQFIGNVTRDPEIRFTNSGTKVANFGLAVNQKRGNQEETLFLNVVAWGNKQGDGLAGIVESYCQKGTKLFISGAMRTSSYEKNGVTVYKTEIHIGGGDTKMVMLGGNPSGGGSPSNDAPGHHGDLDDEIPF